MRYHQSPREKRFLEVLIADETITDSVWTADPDTATLGAGTQFTEGTSDEDGGSRALFGPATAGSYVVTAKLTGSSGQIYERAFAVIVEEPID